jgi:hypothetical protein
MARAAEVTASATNRQALVCGATRQNCNVGSCTLFGTEKQPSIKILYVPHLTQLAAVTSIPLPQSFVIPSSI